MRPDINISKRLKKKFFVFSDMVGVFCTFDDTTQFLLVPKGTENRLNDEKICCMSPLNHIIHPEPMIHVALAGDGYSCDYTPGSTQRNSDTAMSLRLTSQEEERDGDGIRLVSVFENDAGLRVKNVLEQRTGANVLASYNILENAGEEIVVEALPSFNLSGISPFDRFNAPDKIFLSKFFSYWSGEGRKCSVSTDRLSFESSWSGLGIRMEKWSQTGSMPARNQLPFIVLEDKKHGVCWAAAIEAPGSWEIETVFRNGNISIGGGQSDFLTGHWRKKIAKGQSFTTMKAYMTVVCGGLEEACNRLVGMYDYGEMKKAEQDLPVLYNEWCSSWGKPRFDELVEVMPIVRDLGCRYFVIDDGWFKNAAGNGRKVLGDWRFNEEVFPGGIREFSKRVSDNGMVLGLWYEFERVSAESDLFKYHPDWLLTYEHKIILHQGKGFLDFRKPEVISYLREKVIKNLVENKIGYLKVDYNDNIGLGADGAESYGEGLRQHMLAVVSFFEEIKRTLPELILEICASGGMRHEPLFLRLADMVSFSDAHESPCGVNIAFNLHRFIPPWKLQIWAVIRDEYDMEAVNFTCAKAMLGRFCFSGKLASKSVEIRERLKEAVQYYQGIAHIILRGKTILIEDGEIGSYLNPVGAEYLVRESEDGKEKLIYAFSIKKADVDFKISVGNYAVKSMFNGPENLIEAEGTILFRSGSGPLWGSVLHLVSKE